MIKWKTFLKGISVYLPQQTKPDLELGLPIPFSVQIIVTLFLYFLSIDTIKNNYLFLFWSLHVRYQEEIISAYILGVKRANIGSFDKIADLKAQRTE